MINACPKPKHIEKPKARNGIARKQAMPRGKGPKRSTKKKPKTAEQKARAAAKAAAKYAHDYGSVERVQWVKTLPCVGCILLGVNPECARRPRENAHTGKKPGKGLKTHYTTIVPLGRPHHDMYDHYETPFESGSDMRAKLEAFAPEIEADWRRELFAEFTTTPIAARSQGGDSR